MGLETEKGVNAILRGKQSEEAKLAALRGSHPDVRFRFVKGLLYISFDWDPDYGPPRRFAKGLTFHAAYIEAVRPDGTARVVKSKIDDKGGSDISRSLMGPQPHCKTVWERLQGEPLV